jgi:hypothetical protein
LWAAANALGLIPWFWGVTKQARRYDSRTTTFSPEGRLYQVEYAMEAISHAGICVGILAKDGIVLAVEKKITSKLLENISSEKMYKVLLAHYPCIST